MPAKKNSLAAFYNIAGVAVTVSVNALGTVLIKFSNVLESQIRVFLTNFDTEDYPVFHDIAAGTSWTYNPSDPSTGLNLQTAVIGGALTLEINT
jgi:hypothetical protein